MRMSLYPGFPVPAGADPERTKSLMEKYETEQKMQLPEDVWTTLKDLVQGKRKQKSPIQVSIK